MTSGRPRYSAGPPVSIASANEGPTSLGSALAAEAGGAISAVRLPATASRNTDREEPGAHEGVG